MGAGVSIVSLCLPTVLSARATQNDPADTLRVFLDCGRCDDEYFRTQVTFVNYVRDRRDADIHVLVTTEAAGGGGRVFTLSFIGQETFAGVDDVLEFVSAQTDTDDEEREGLAQIFGLGLLRYLARTPLAGQVAIGQAGTRERRAMATPEDDPWNFWVYRARVRASVRGEESRKSQSYNGSLSANRTTDDWKIRLGVNANYNETEFQLTDGAFTNISRNYAADGRVVKTVGDHMGLAVGGSLVRSTFRNQDLSGRVAPAVQYNFFSYDESTRREFTLTYAVGLNAFSYEAETIFGVFSEIRPDHNVNVSLDYNEPWGEAGVTVEYAQFLDDASKHRSMVFGDVELRIARGVFFNINGRTSLIRDQIYLPKEDLTNEEILVQRRQLATDYDFRVSVGLTFTFGSIYNNVVNSRFAGSSGGFIRSF